jgi:hypothetical protein
MPYVAHFLRNIIHTRSTWTPQFLHFNKTYFLQTITYVMPNIQLCNFEEQKFCSWQDTDHTGRVTNQQHAIKLTKGGNMCPSTSLGLLSHSCVLCIAGVSNTLNNITGIILMLTSFPSWLEKSAGLHCTSDLSQLGKSTDKITGQDSQHNYARPEKTSCMPNKRYTSCTYGK